MQKNSVKYQYYATFCVNILMIAYGSFCGWLSASLLILQSNETPLESGQLTNEEASWIGSLLCVGGFTGNLLFGWLSDRFGRKISILLIVVPLTLSWIFILIAKNALYLCCSRFIGGVAGGGIFSVLPVYVTEISEDQIRGSLGSYLVLCGNIGVLFSFILGNYLSYYMIPYIFILLPIFFLIGFIFMPETPQYLLKMKKEKEAEYALRYFRNLRKISQEPPEKFKNELQKLKQDYLEEDKLNDDIPLSFRDFTNKIARKGLTIGVILMALNQFCGCFAMLNYTATIFKQAGSNLEPNMAAIVVGVIQLLGSQASTFFVERAGRKLLISLSAILTGFGLTCLGTYSLLDTLNYDITNFKWIPVASFSFVIFVASLGVLTLPFLVVAEILPPKIRNIGTMVCMNLLWFFSFLCLKYLPILTKLFGMYGCMYIFATCSFIGGILVIILVPETKGKSNEEILAMLE